jgi:hypothetical protein
VNVDKVCASLTVVLNFTRTSPGTNSACAAGADGAVSSVDFFVVHDDSRSVTVVSTPIIAGA